MEGRRQAWVDRVLAYVTNHAKAMPTSCHFMVSTEEAVPVFRQRVPGMVLAVIPMQDNEPLPVETAVELFVPFPEEFNVVDIRVLCEATISEHLLAGLIGVT